MRLRPTEPLSPAFVSRYQDLSAADILTKVDRMSMAHRSRRDVRFWITNLWSGSLVCR